MGKKSRRRRNQGDAGGRGGRVVSTETTAPSSSESVSAGHQLDNIRHLLQKDILNILGSMPTFQEREEWVQKLLQFPDAAAQSELLDELTVRQFQAAPYYATYQQGYDAVKEENLRFGSDLAWNAFKQATDWGGTMSPGRPWMLTVAVYRCSLFLEPRGVRRLRRLFSDENELTAVRLIAAEALGGLVTDELSSEETLEILRCALVLEPTTKELKLRTVYPVKTGQQVTSHSELIQQAKELCRDRLDERSKPKSLKNEPSFSGDNVLLDVREAVLRRDDYELHRRTAEIGGCKCDYCQTPVEELGVAKLNFCSQCQNAYYCGEECQRKAWKEGHKQACRPTGYAYKGDIVRLVGLKSNPSLNGRLVKVVGQNPDSGQWLVHLMQKVYPSDDVSNIFEIKTKNMKHIRPAA